MAQWWTPSKADDIQPIPWLSPEATEYLESLLRPEFEILEHGSGGSTLWFADRVKFVAAIEDDDDWAQAVREQGRTNLRVENLHGFPVYGKMFGDRFDLLLIDGEPVEDRCKWIEAAPKLVKRGGYVVLDNANRPEYAKERKALAKTATLLKTFDGNGGHHQYLVTEFYQMKGKE